MPAVESSAGPFHRSGPFRTVSSPSLCGPSTSTLRPVSTETSTFAAPFNTVSPPQFDSPPSLSPMMISPRDLPPSPSKDRFVLIPPPQWDSPPVSRRRSPSQSQDPFVVNSPPQWDSPLFGSSIGSYRQPSDHIAPSTPSPSPSYRAVPPFSFSPLNRSSPHQQTQDFAIVTIVVIYIIGSS